MFCRHCGAEIPDGSNYCINCGKKTGREESAATKRVYAAAELRDAEDAFTVQSRSASDNSQDQGHAERRLTADDFRLTESTEETEKENRRPSVIVSAVKKKPLLAFVVAVVLISAAMTVFFISTKPVTEPADELGTEDLTPQAEQAAEEETSEAAPEPEDKEDKNEESAFSETMYVMSEDGLFLREGPGGDNKVIRTLSYGTELSVEEIEDGWAYVKADGVCGWCSAEYLTAEKDEIKAETARPASGSDNDSKLVKPSDTGGEGYKAKVSAKDGLNMRYGPGEDYGIICAIPYDKAVSVTARQDGWLYVKYKGRYGWVSEDYVA